MRELGHKIVQKHVNFSKFTSREITEKPLYSGHLVIADPFFQEPQVSAIDKFDFNSNVNLVLREKCTNKEFFLSDYGKIPNKNSLYSEIAQAV